MPEQHDGRLIDRFDAFPGTFNFVAVADGRVVGGVRLIHCGEMGFPAQDYFDFSDHIPAGARLGSGSMFVVAPSYRRCRLPLALTGFAYYWSMARELTHMAIVASPLSEQGFLSAGYKMLTPRFHHAASGLLVTPMLLSLSELDERLLSFARHQKTDYAIDGHERCLLSQGDVLLEKGEYADALYVILDGEVGLHAEDGELREVLGPGASLGEASLLLDHPSAHMVTALSSVVLMVVRREAFYAQVQAGGDAAIQSLRLLARRLEGETQAHVDGPVSHHETRISPHSKATEESGDGAGAEA